MPFDQQLNLLESRGLLIPDKRRALAELKRIGYYRLSAYWYPYRELPENGQPVTATVRRRDSFIAGATFDHALALYTFDEKLRAILMQGVEILEITLRVQIGYHLGKIDPFAHLAPQHLSAYAREERGGGETHHEHWLRKYRERCTESATEDYVRHFHEKYEGELPIWVATEIMNFGALVRLLQFLPESVQTTVARTFGVQRAKDFSSWCRSLNVVRNHCAHHARLWNRVFPYPPSKVQPNRVSENIRHLAKIPDADRARVYYLAALLASMIRTAVPSSNWPRTTMSTVRKFPEVPQFTVATMGFPEGWDDLPLWSAEPTKWGT